MCHSISNFYTIYNAVKKIIPFFNIFFKMKKEKKKKEEEEEERENSEG
jgi:hypothetical protein